MKLNMKFLTGFIILLTSLSLHANQPVVGQQPEERTCCTECVDAGRTRTTETAIDPNTGLPAGVSGSAGR